MLAVPLVTIEVMVEEMSRRWVEEEELGDGSVSLSLLDPSYDDEKKLRSTYAIEKFV